MFSIANDWYLLSLTPLFFVYRNIGGKLCRGEEMQRRYNAHSHWWRRHGTSSHCSGEGTSIFLYLLMVNVIFSVVWSAHPRLYCMFQNVYAVLDLYGKVTAVSIVSSTLVEDSESVKAPSLSSDSCSEGEEDSTPVREVCLLKASYFEALSVIYFNLTLNLFLFFVVVFFLQLSVRMSLHWFPR